MIKQAIYGGEDSVGDAFFDSKAEAARLKHLILRKYLPPFISKVGSTATDGRVVVVDGYAGPGRYEDGSEGSPLILSGYAANPPGGGNRKVDVVLVEKDVAHHKLLHELLAQHPVTGVRTPIHGRVTEHLDDILVSAEAQPMFAYLDPYGLDVAWTDLADKIFARPGMRYAPATEILLNLSAAGIRRIGGVLDAAPYSGRRKTLERLTSRWAGTGGATSGDRPIRRARRLKSLPPSTPGGYPKQATLTRGRYLLFEKRVNSRCTTSCMQRDTLVATVSSARRCPVPLRSGAELKCRAPCLRPSSPRWKRPSAPSGPESSRATSPPSSALGPRSRCVSTIWPSLSQSLDRRVRNTYGRL